MSLLGRLFGPRRPAPPAGRHSRALAGPSVPGAAASLVQTAAAADALAAAVAEAGARGPAPVPVAADEPSVPPALSAVAAAVPLSAQPAPPIPAWAEHQSLLAPEAPVTLGFADGASVELAADDPRVRTFRAAAAALLDAPRG